MNVIDKTPFRSATGQIETLGRLQGSLKYGLSWYDRVMAQDVVARALSKQLSSQYVLIQNPVLPGTDDISLPLVLVGPNGVLLINVLHEKGVYRAREEEWGTISSERFVPARINHVRRTQTFGKVLEVYLERQGYKGSVTVEPVLMAADPGLHIDSTRPAVRVVMSDALERFAVSITQARVSLTPETVQSIVRIISGEKEEEHQPEASPERAAKDSFDFAFEEETEAEPQPAPQTPAPADPEPAPPPKPASVKPRRPAASPKTAKPKKLFGLSTRQVILLAALLLFWLCGMAAFGFYIYSNLL